VASYTVPTELARSVSPKLLTHYVGAFRRLHRNRNPRLGDAPHKPVLLLAILDGIEQGAISGNRIGLTPELVAAFHSLWRALVPGGTWSDKIIYPFRYLAHEKFWTLQKDGHPVAPGDMAHPTSIGQFLTVADAGRFADSLWPLLQDRTARSVLRTTLLDTYFPGAPLSERSVVAQAADVLAAEAARLLDEAREVRFRRQPLPKLVREGDAAYLRHYLFPGVVIGLYDHQCAVCRLGVHDDQGRFLVEAAHIMPHARFGNDDPRNGLALCPSHHRGFDAGWFSLSDAYSLLVSPRLSGGVSAYVEEGVRIGLPVSDGHRPAREALGWHRENVWLRPCRASTSERRNHGREYRCDPLWTSLAT
jgi:putative restriction endonuclease